MIYHYTKGYTLGSIFNDGFIATERKRGLSRIRKNTDFVWLTAQQRFPKTALPNISSIPSSNLALHTSIRGLVVDYDAIAAECEGLFRFGFSSEDKRFKRWWHSEERKQMLNNTEWRSMESLANKVGDEVRQFWISTDDVWLCDYTLERFENGQWTTLIDTLNYGGANDSTYIVDTLCGNAERWTRRYGFEQDSFKLAA
jgi:hypothetical protein